MDRLQGDAFYLHPSPAKPPFAHVITADRLEFHSTYGRVKRPHDHPSRIGRPIESFAPFPSTGRPAEVLIGSGTSRYFDFFNELVNHEDVAMEVTSVCLSRSVGDRFTASSQDTTV